jgi:hypothetical protein
MNSSLKPSKPSLINALTQNVDFKFRSADYPGSSEQLYTLWPFLICGTLDSPGWQPGGRVLYLAFWTFFLLPLLFFAIACRSAKHSRLPLIPLTLSAALLVASTAAHSVKHWLLGADYSDQLYLSLETNLALALLVGGYLAFKRDWMAAVGAGILAFDWFYLMAVNSIV